ARRRIWEIGSTGERRSARAVGRMELESAALRVSTWWHCLAHICRCLGEQPFEPSMSRETRLELASTERLVWRYALGRSTLRDLAREDWTEGSQSSRRTGRSARTIGRMIRDEVGHDSSAEGVSRAIVVRSLLAMQARRGRAALAHSPLGGLVRCERCGGSWEATTRPA